METPQQTQRAEAAPREVAGFLVSAPPSRGGGTPHHHPSISRPCAAHGSPVHPMCTEEADEVTIDRNLQKSELR